MLKVSIITASYNSVRTISDSIESVMMQTYENIEYIIVDGGSEDGTLEIIEKYEAKFGDRLKYISERDKGIYDAMNKGIHLSTGDIVGILNSDDYYTSNDVVERLTAAFDDRTVDAVYGDVHFIRNGQPDKVVRYYSSKMFHPFWLRFGFMPAHPSFYVRRSVYEQAGDYKLDYRIGSDFEMMVRLFRHQRIHAVYLPMDFVTMRMGGASTNGLRSHRLLLQEDTRACRENGIYTNRFFISLKYLYKILEFKF